MKSTRTPPTPPVFPGPAWRSQQWSRRASPLRKLARLVVRRRRLFAAMFLCAAASLAVQQLTPASPITTGVMVASRDLPAGHVLSANDLKSAKVSPQMVPDGAIRSPAAGVLAAGAPPPVDSSTEWLGLQVSGPIRRGEVLTDASLLGTGLLAGAPAGSQAVPLRLSDPSTLTLLRQGQLVTVVLSSSQGMDGPVTNETLAENVPVLWAPDQESTGGGLLPAQESDGVVVVAASATQAVKLAGAISRGKVFLILHN
ncbi:RcpC/CpaB family pilus assembly protein [Arthrobacter alpinus]|uniref:RcpC/CpaB family pilus assembly protein n=1 Tax=Arthrobacter alpinus TaxID=656366 RepID=UPI001EF5E9FE|nr:RcpC/CpaB family pilus assembly protein [Arthrobacter alpinus]